MIATRRQRKAGIYLVQPKFPPTYWGMHHFLRLGPFDAVYPPLGLLTLAALTPPEYTVTLCDQNAGETVDFETTAEIVGITGYIIQDREVFTMADRFRARGKTVVLGGPLANLMPEACRPHCDVLFEGEAEYTWPRFLRDFAEGCPADHYVQSEMVHLPDSPLPRLDVLPKRYAHGVVQCTRGCPFTCEFCDIIVMYGRKMRFKPVEQVLREIEAWQRRNVFQVFFSDDNFVGNRAYAKELLRALLAWNARQRRPMSFSTQVSVDMVRDQELLGLLRDANFIMVFLGLESPRKASLAEARKIQNERLDLVEAIHTIQSYNLFIQAGMIVGFDHDDASIFNEQYAFLQEAQIPMAMINVLTALPRTPLYERLKAEGRLLSPVESRPECESDLRLSCEANFHPLHLTREEVARGYDQLYRRLYAPDAFRARLQGNLARFRNIRYRPEPFHMCYLPVLWRVWRCYAREGAAGRRFFWGCLWNSLRRSPRMVFQTLVILGMYLHFWKFHSPSWNPWQPSNDDLESCSGASEGNAPGSVSSNGSLSAAHP